MVLGPWGAATDDPRRADRVPDRRRSGRRGLGRQPGAAWADSVPRPGATATGFMELEYSMGGKWLELLKEIAPSVTRAAVLRDTALGSGTSLFAVIQAVAPLLRVAVEVGTL